MTLRITRTALRQIEAAIGYVEVRAPAGAEGIRTRIGVLLSILHEHPFAGQATTRAGVRRLTLTPLPYVLFYRLAGDEIVVMRFQHASRRPFIG